MDKDFEPRKKLMQDFLTAVYEEAPTIERREAIARLIDFLELKDFELRKKQGDSANELLINIFKDLNPAK